MSFAFRPLPPIGDALFRLDENGAFFFAPLSLAEDLPLPDEPVPVTTLPPPAAATPEAPPAEPAPLAPVAEAPSTAPAAEPAAIIAEQPAPPEPPPAAPAAPEMADLYAQYANLYADFDGQAALADLLQSAWAQANQWGDAGVAPLG